MALYKDHAIIIKQRDFMEADKIFTLLTLNHGKIEAVAKGIRRAKSRKSGNLEFLNSVKLSIAKGKKLDVITEVQLLHDYRVLKENLELTYSTFYIAEITERLVPLGYESEKVFHLFQDFVHLFESPRVNTKLLMRAFEIKLLSTLDIGPNVTECFHCAKPLNEGQSFRAVSDACAFSDDCEDNSGKRIDIRILKIIKFILANSLENILILNITRSDLNILKSLSVQWISDIIGTNIRSAKLLNEYAKKY